MGMMRIGDVEGAWCWYKKCDFMIYSCAVARGLKGVFS